MKFFWSKEIFSKTFRIAMQELGSNLFIFAGRIQKVIININKYIGVIWTCHSTKPGSLMRDITFTRTFIATIDIWMSRTALEFLQVTGNSGVIERRCTCTATFVIAKWHRTGTRGFNKNTISSSTVFIRTFSNGTRLVERDKKFDWWTTFSLTVLIFKRAGNRDIDRCWAVLLQY